MDRDLMNISKIETYLHDKVFKGKVSDNLFVGRLPDTLDKSWKDIAMIDCGTNIYDRNGYAMGSFLVWLFVKPKANGVKDVKRMSQMELAADDCITTARHQNYVISKRSSKSGYDSTHDLYYTVIDANLTII